jgi:predicted phosphodiesterase
MLEQTNSKKIQYVSDIHTELRKWNNIPIIPPIEDGCCLVLGGDIGNPFSLEYERFLSKHCMLYEWIFVIAGNHEYYSSKKQYTIREVDQRLEDVCSRYPNVIYMNKKKVVIGNTAFLGCTLWSFVTKETETLMNDYLNIYVDTTRRAGMFSIPSVTEISKKKYIRENKRLLTFQDVNLLHNDMTKWLYDSIKETQEYNIVILTHHAPTQQMDREIPNIAYSSNCEYMFGGKVSHWISGHTHLTKSIMIDGTLCLSNCCGYPDERIPYSLTSYISIS